MKELPKTLELVEYSEDKIPSLELGFYLVVNSNGITNVEFFNGFDFSATQTKISWVYLPKIK